MVLTKNSSIKVILSILYLYVLKTVLKNKKLFDCVDRVLLYFPKTDKKKDFHILLSTKKN